MAALAQLLANHASILILDAASTVVQVGLLRRSNPSLWETSSVESGQALFTCTSSCLRGAGLELRDITAFIYCEGPGSMLGIRTAVMAIRTWQAELPRSAYAYQSLAVAGSALQHAKPGHAFHAIADARRDSWHVQSFDSNSPTPLRRLAGADLPAGELVMPAHFRTWSRLPRPATNCNYDLAEIFTRLGDGDFFRETRAPEVFQHEAPEYKKWSAQVHSAATASAR